MKHMGRTAGGALLRREWRELGRLALESLAAGMFVSLVLALAVFIVSVQAQAAPPETGHGTLQLGTDTGARIQAPLLFTDVQMNVSGITARVQVSQRFVNPTAEWREGIYVFPLPENAAVDHLTMQVGERTIVGQIRERGEAKRTYETARTEGRKSTLIEEERPNLFTTSVANIGPGEEIVVAIEYQQTLRYDDGAFSLRFPLAITPRYIPGAVIAADPSETGRSPATAQVPDAARITPPVTDRHAGYVNPVRIAVELDAGFALSKLASTYHPVKIEEHPGNRFSLWLADGPVPAARDFELTWTPDVGAAAGAALFTETKGGKTYALLMALPPSSVAGAATRVPREITYIIDTSGSMEGVSMVQARDALLLALARLQPGDRFNVIEFNSVTTPLFTAPMPLDAATLSRARAFVSGLRARGGTEMLPALAAALTGEREASFMRQVVFLTDGAVGNEDAILQLIHDQIGDRRLFTVGIGPAPNMFFMTKAAQFGRGTFTAIGDVREVKEKMTALFRKLENPALTDISVAWPAGADVWPRIVPDLYAGEPVVVTAQFNASAASGNIAIAGRQGAVAWSRLLPVGVAADQPGIAVLWARARIEALMDAGRKGGAEDETRAAVLDVALTHHLVSKYTSLVAVDPMPSRPSGVAAPTTAVPGNIPDGLTGFDQLPRTATPAMLSIVAGCLALLLAGLLAFSLRHAGARIAAVMIGSVLALTAPDDSFAQSPPTRHEGPTGTLLLPGHYDGDIGSYDFELDRAPAAGWFVLVKDAAESSLRRIADVAGGRPPFLRELQAATMESTAMQDAMGRLFYLNLAAGALHEGPVREVPLRRRALRPQLDHPYLLSLDATPFTLTASNGRKGRDGAYYVIEVGGERYEYLLDGYGWDSEIRFAGDLDHDGKPDFIIYVGGNNSGAWYVLLSSQAAPGFNKPAAHLVATGC